MAASPPSPCETDAPHGFHAGGGGGSTFRNFPERTRLNFHRQPLVLDCACKVLMISFIGKYMNRGTSQSYLHMDTCDLIEGTLRQLKNIFIHQTLRK